MTGALEAFTEVRLSGGVETGELGDILREVPEVQEFFTIAGDPDALVRIRVDDVDHLQRVVNAMRRTGKLTSNVPAPELVSSTWPEPSWSPPFQAVRAERVGIMSPGVR